MFSHRFRRTMVLLAALLTLLFPGVTGIAYAQPIPSIYLPLVTAPPPTAHNIAIKNATMKFYTVQGATEDEMRASIDSLRPGAYDALTEWNFNWFVPSDGGSCKLDEATVDYTITVTFPQWTPPAEASVTLIQKWNNYVDALGYHENGHVERVYPFVPDLVDRIKSSSCDSYNEAAQAWLSEINQSNVDYDAETDHGATQGAVFP